MHCMQGSYVATYPPAPFPYQGKGELKIREGLCPSLKTLLLKENEKGGNAKKIRYLYCLKGIKRSS